VTLAQRWFDTISAPHKQFITIPDAGHTVSLTHGDRFLHALTEALAKNR
jgi:pimeloyl-ACP methyl ester carboxylesterase